MLSIGCMLPFSNILCSKLLWLRQIFCVTRELGSTCGHTGLRVNCQILTKTGMWPQILVELPTVKFQELTHANKRTGRLTGVTKPTGAWQHFAAKAPLNPGRENVQHQVLTKYWSWLLNFPYTPTLSPRRKQPFAFLLKSQKTRALNCGLSLRLSDRGS
jgi:hypothetical protein